MPDASRKASLRILINARERTLNTTGSVRVLLVNAATKITLWRGELHVKLPQAGAGQTLFSFDTSKFGGDVLGFGVRDRVDVVLTADGVRMPIALALPKILGDVRGNAVLLASKGKGLRLDSLRFATERERDIRRCAALRPRRWHAASELRTARLAADATRR